MTASPESEEQRVTRRRRRVLFESVPERYRDCRHGYPADIVDWMVATTGVAAGGSMLEIGCGTGLDLHTDIAMAQRLG